MKGSVFYDLHRNDPYRLDVFSASVKDGRDNTLHRKLFVIESRLDRSMSIRQPTIFHDLSVAPIGTTVPDSSDLPNRDKLEEKLILDALNPFLEQVTAEREKETGTVRSHIEISLNELIHRQNLRCAELVEEKEKGDTSPLLAANLKQCEDKIDLLNNRLERRQKELEQERQCTIGDVTYLGSSWVLPHPERMSPDFAPMVRDDEIEFKAIEAVIHYEEARGWEVESVEQENRGFDLISRKPHSEDPKTYIEVRFIEVKGRTGYGEVALTTNEYKTAERLRKDYWLYVVFNCDKVPELQIINDPAKLGWEPLIKVEHYHIGAKIIRDNSEDTNQD